MGIPLISASDSIVTAAPELTDSLRTEIRNLIAAAPEAYISAHHVEECDGELFEDWNWLIMKCRRAGC